jgi:hypothetical protein
LRRDGLVHGVVAPDRRGRCWSVRQAIRAHAGSELVHGVLLVVMTSLSGSLVRLATKQEFGTTDAH